MFRAIDATSARGAHRSRGVRVGVFLLVFTLLPLAFAGWVGATSLADLRSTERRTARIEPAVRDYVALQALRGALTRERYYFGAEAAVTKLGVDPAAVREIVGVDIATELQDARTEVDRLFAEVGDAEMVALVTTAREDDAAALTPANRFDDASEVVGRRAQVVYDGLRAEVGALDSGTQVSGALRVLESVTTARQALSHQTNDYLDIRFSGRADVDAAVRRLIEQRALYRRSMAEAERLAAPGSAVAGALAAPSTGDGDRFFLAIEQLIAASLASGERQETAMAVLVANFADAAGAYKASTALAEAHLALVDDAGQDVFAGIDALTSAQSRDAHRSVLVIGAISTASLLFAIALGSIFGRPLRRLALQARALSEGEAATVTAPKGPAEVRRAAEALNAATENLRLVESQALALARGDLDADVLHQSARGAVGVSLQEAVRTLAASMGEREEFQRRLTHEATHDGLTHLANRKASLAQLQRSLARTSRSTSTVALMFIDLDGFKDVNDTHGHQAGDLVLRTVAQRLVTRVREGDHVGRLGGDEFVVIAEPVESVDEAMALAGRLLDALSEPIALEGSPLRIGASIGVSVANLHDANADDLLRDADLAVYQAKAHGRGCIELCTDELRATLAAQADLEHAIRHGIATDEFVMHYQPIISTEGGGVHSFEALVRWNRPELGMAWPDAFIPFAERSGLILEIDRWVIRRVAEQLAEWSGVSELARASVAVNVSGRSLSSDTFVEDVLGPLRELGIDPSRLVVEVTESALLEDLDLAAEKLERLRAVGVRTAIDDFGTGYTSLAHLKTLPIDILKIDRSFTNDPSAESLVKLIIDTGHLLGATIVAEGIESDDQARHLTHLGSDELQGYLFGRPCAPGDLDATQVRSTVDGAR